MQFLLCPCLGNRGLSSYHPTNLPGHAHALLSKAPLSITLASLTVRSLYGFPDLYPLCLFSSSPSSLPPSTELGEICSSPLPTSHDRGLVVGPADPGSYSLEGWGKISDVGTCSGIFSSSVEARSPCPLGGGCSSVSCFQDLRAVYRFLIVISLQIRDFSSELPCM